MLKLFLPLAHKAFNTTFLLSNCPLCCRNKILGSFSFSTNEQPINLKERVEKSINVSIIGVPNAGKSTLINSLMNRKICAASNKVHTTKTVARAISVVGDTQIVFLDTPGIVTTKEQQKYNLKPSMVVDPYKTVKKADIIGVIHDASNAWTRESLDPILIHILKKNEHIPSFLIINKIDVLKSKRRLLEIIRLLTKGQIAGKKIDVAYKRRKDPPVEKGFAGFSDVFMVSALEGDGVDKIKEYLAFNATPKKWAFPEHLWSDQSPENLIVEAVRAKFLSFLSQELPYKLITEMEYFEENDEKVVTLVAVTCPSQRIEKLIAGAEGGRLKHITDSARNDLMDMFQKSVSLTITLRSEITNVNE